MCKGMADAVSKLDPDELAILGGDHGFFFRRAIFFLRRLNYAGREALLRPAGTPDSDGQATNKDTKIG